MYTGANIDGALRYTQQRSSAMLVFKLSLRALWKTPIDALAS